MVGRLRLVWRFARRWSVLVYPLSLSPPRGAASLVEEWESLVNPGEAAAKETELVSERAPRLLDSKALQARIRAELHQLLQALARGDYAGAAACIAQTEDAWPAGRFEEELAPVLESQNRLRTDPEARLISSTAITCSV